MAENAGESKASFSLIKQSFWCFLPCAALRRVSKFQLTRGDGRHLHFLPPPSKQTGGRCVYLETRRPDRPKQEKAERELPASASHLLLCEPSLRMSGRQELNCKYTHTCRTNSGFHESRRCIFLCPAGGR